MVTQSEKTTEEISFVLRNTPLELQIHWVYVHLPYATSVYGCLALVAISHVKVHLRLSLCVYRTVQKFVLCKCNLMSLTGHLFNGES
jgi:hypothetical protein